MTVETNLSSRALLGVCLGIEAVIGRVRTFKNGPRVIDLDLLFYENETAEMCIRDRAMAALPKMQKDSRRLVLTASRNCRKKESLLTFRI